MGLPECQNYIFKGPPDRQAVNEGPAREEAGKEYVAGRDTAPRAKHTRMPAFGPGPAGVAGWVLGAFGTRGVGHGERARGQKRRERRDLEGLKETLRPRVIRVSPRKSLMKREEHDLTRREPRPDSVTVSPSTSAARTSSTT